MENREIKFEYGFESVNGIIKKQYFLHEIPLIREKCDLWNDLPIVYVRQFTGLKDKNGKEIYDGYILKHNKKKFYIKYSKNQFVLLLKEVGSKTNWRSLEWCNNVSKYIEIIGNIYENPELLN